MSVYKAMAAVMADVSKVGVAKDQKNTQQNFMYRGVDGVMNALAPILSKHGLLIVPSILERTSTERQSKSGGVLFHVLLKVRFAFIAAEDGSKHEIELLGEAMDSGDKATNKALAVAYKYACFQAFCIPLEGVDPDAETHETVETEEQKRRKQSKEYAERITVAFESGLEQPVLDIHAELKPDEELYRATWGQLPSGMRRQIKDMIDRNRVPEPA